MRITRIILLGSLRYFFDGNDLIGAVTFEPEELNPLAEKIFQKVKFGTLRMASVGMIPKGEPVEDEKMGALVFPGQELLEWSIVHIPSNPEAAKREMSNEVDNFLELASTALEMDVEDLRKLTMKGITDLMTGEGVKKDEEEAKESQQIDNEEEARRVRWNHEMDGYLMMHKDFDEKIERQEKKAREIYEEEQKRMRRRYL